MKNKKNYILLFIFTVLVIFFTLKDNFSSIVDNILNLNKLWFIYALFIIVGNWFFRALILKHYVSYYRKDYTFKKAFKLQLETAFFNGITPFSSGGQPFQVIMLRKDGVQVGHGANIIFITSFIYQFALFIIATISIIINQYLHLFSANSYIKYLSIFGYLVNIVFMTILLLFIFSKKFKKSIVKLMSKILIKMKFIKKRDVLIAKLGEQILIMEESSKVIRKDRIGFIKTLFYNLMAMICYFIIPVALSLGMGINNINALSSIITSSYVLLVGMFIPIPGGTGGLEFAFVVLFANMINVAEAKSMMLVWRFITYYLGMIVGGIVLNLDKRKD